MQKKTLISQIQDFRSWYFLTWSRNLWSYCHILNYERSFNIFFGNKKYHDLKIHSYVIFTSLWNILTRCHFTNFNIFTIHEINSIEFSLTNDCWFDGQIQWNMVRRSKKQRDLWIWICIEEIISIENFRSWNYFSILMSTIMGDTYFLCNIWIIEYGWRQEQFTKLDFQQKNDVNQISPRFCYITENYKFNSKFAAPIFHTFETLFKIHTDIFELNFMMIKTYKFLESWVFWSMN